MCQLSCVMTPLWSTHSTFHRTWLYSAILHRSRVHWSPHGGYGVQLTGVQAWAHLSKWKPFHRQPPVFFTGSPEYFVNCHQKYFVKCSPPLRIVTTWTPRRTLLKLWNRQLGHHCDPLNKYYQMTFLRFSSYCGMIKVCWRMSRCILVNSNEIMELFY